MSGPKSSSYVISARQRALLLEQQKREQERRLEQQRIKREGEKRDRLAEDVNGQLTRIDQTLERIKLLLRESGRSPEEAKSILTMRSALEEQFSKILKKTAYSSSELKVQNAELTSLQKMLSESLKSADTLVETLGESYRQELQDTIQSGFSLSFEGIGAKKKQDDPHLKRINDLLAGLGNEIPAPLRERFQSIRRQADAITDADYLENFCALVVVPFVSTCQKCENWEEHETYYRMLAAEAHVQPLVFDCDADGLQAMLKACDQLQGEILEDRERAYINEALDAAMQEMGYRLVGSRDQVKRSGKHVRHELYSLQNGTAVDVTYAENGQIAMELGGIGTTDRSPTAEESEQLTEDMRSFCRDYAELERKLAERGVLSTMVSHMPPSEEFAQIFNANDYLLTDAVTSYSVERKKTGRNAARSLS